MILEYSEKQCKCKVPWSWNETCWDHSKHCCNGKEVGIGRGRLSEKSRTDTEVSHSVTLNRNE